ncbi:MAG TPA: tRNA lysidine(34) synthetase TilS [Flavobacteriales bacterium]|nr:tRNA lysidine(34) synthetase TilS [Flavobacteriales bacterium]
MMIGEVRRTMRVHELAQPGQPLWVAVSGGLDSMVLLHVLRALGHPCHVAHVDHGLRGSESDEDREFVVAQCAALRIPCEVRRVDVIGRARITGESTQMAARALRLGWFRELAAAGPDRVALAHHVDDALESFFLGLMRGLGAGGWSGIRPQSEAFIRPFIGVDRAAILAYAQAHRIPWREDVSNADGTYLRNRVRHELLPLFEQWRPGTRHNLSRNMRLFAELDHLAREAGDTAMKEITIDADGVTRIPFRTILNGAPLIVLHRLLRDKGFHPDRLEDILAAIRDQHTGTRFPADGVEALVDREELVIMPRASRPGPWRFEHVDDVHPDAPLRITAAAFEEVDPAMGPLTAWLDAERIAWPLDLRPWRPGDRMRPDGLGGSKLISDILIDAKVPGDRKDRVLVLADAERILWLCGHRIAEGAKATAAGSRVLRLDLLGA